MKDIQSQLDHRRVNIKKVGVKTISYPIAVLDKRKRRQHTVATVNMYVNLPHHFKGAHMSRFIEILNRFHGEIDLNSFHDILEEMKDRLDAQASHIEINFPYFLKRENVPDSLTSRRYECRMHGSLEDGDELEFTFIVPVSLPLNEQKAASLPNSWGHWGTAAVAVRFRRFVWIEDLIQRVEKTIGEEQEAHNIGDREIFSVESLTRKIARSLSGCEEVKWYSVRVENLGEGYSTFATMESGKQVGLKGALKN